MNPIEITPAYFALCLLLTALLAGFFGWLIRDTQDDRNRKP